MPAPKSQQARQINTANKYPSEVKRDSCGSKEMGFIKSNEEFDLIMIPTSIEVDPAKMHPTQEGSHKANHKAKRKIKFVRNRNKKKDVWLLDKLLNEKKNCYFNKVNISAQQDHCKLVEMQTIHRVSEDVEPRILLPPCLRRERLSNWHTRMKK